jgi:D-arabinan exo alpha-(1,3)/(1,5)-arabinofuranosidase (non-reducing end)
VKNGFVMSEMITPSTVVARVRRLLGDAVPFGSSIDFGIEHGPVDDVAATYSSTAYWYGANTAALTRTDTLTVGDRTSEAAHGYTSSDPGAVTNLTSTYEGNDGPAQPVTAATRATTAPVTFRLKVNPAGHSVVLTRTSDQVNAYQQAQVSVDGHRLPDWQQPLGNPGHRWLDDTYLLPASVTAGRTQITVTLTPVSGGPAWSAARYTAWSAK